MDGFALRSSDLGDGQAELAIVEEIPAGKTPTRTVTAGQASRIMTGAPMPVGADAVVMIERCELAGNKVRVNDPALTSGQNILPRGKELRVGETIVRAGTSIRPQELGMLAALGRTSARVQPRPRVAILSTGDELVDASVKPGAGQIRNSNGPMLMAQVARIGAVPHFLGIARDEPTHLRALIAEGLQADVLLLSGGVSAGKLDLVPDMLAELGVQALFHKVAMKPGKPLLFGVKDGRLVFGLPGNPVASMLCGELFVRPALRAMMARDPGSTWVIAATLAKDFVSRSDRATYHPARLQMTDAGWMVTPVAWFGSPDLRGVLAANAFMVVGAGERHYKVGGRFEVLCVEEIEYADPNGNE
jgi:molybdopterin molybdotransferase